MFLKGNSAVCLKGSRYIIGYLKYLFKLLKEGINFEHNGREMPIKCKFVNIPFASLGWDKLAAHKCPHHSMKANLQFLCLKSHSHRAIARAGAGAAINPSDTVIHTERERERGLKRFFCLFTCPRSVHVDLLCSK